MNRGAYLTLGVVGATVALIALGSGNALFATLAIGGFVALLAAVFANDRLKQLRETLPTLAASAKSSPAAKTAVARARKLSSFAPEEIVSDVGLIVNEKDQQGRWRRRIAESSVSMDEQMVQPVVKFTAPLDRLNRIMLIRFDILDKNGKTQFSRQVEHYVREGENLVPSDTQLKLNGNKALGRAGTWELQVTINGNLAAVHHFTMTPRRDDVVIGAVPTAADAEIDMSRLRAPKEEEMPMSLEDLLREQRGSNHRE
jgi:hypothetical protein